MNTQEINVWLARQKGRSCWECGWYDPDTGRRRSKSTGTSDRKEAKRFRDDLEYELRHEQHREPSQMEWDDFRDRFRAEYLVGKRASTRTKYDDVLDVFEQVVSPKRLGDITERTISRFVTGLWQRERPGGKVGLAPHTVRSYAVAVKAALNWARSQRMIDAVPEFPRIKVPKRRPQPIPTESFEKLVEKAPDATWRAYLLCGWWAGLRLSEALELRWEQSDLYPWLDWKGNRIVLPAVFAKSGEDQTVPLHVTLKDALEALPRGDGRVFPLRGQYGQLMSRNAVTQRVLRLARKAGVKLSMHRLRKGFGCRVAKQLGKGNAPILHTLMRHSSMQVTMDYYASVDDALQTAMAGLS